MKRVFPVFAASLCLLSTTLVAATPAQRQAHVEWMLSTLPEVPEWSAWQKATGALPPDFEALPRSNALPDPLRFLDGRPVAIAADWAARRAEIRQLLETHVTGSFPPKPPLLRALVLDETRGDGYLTRNLRLEYGPEGRAMLRVRVVIPEGAGPRPALIAPNLAGWAPSLIRRGYVSVGFAGNDFMDDAAPLKELYPDHDFATLPRRAWAVQLVLDYLETVPEIDARRIALFGYSRDGKMATIAAALDERIAALIAGSTGVGGVLPWRLSGERGSGEGIESTTRMFPTWFAPQLRFFSGYEDRLPVDANLLVALIAPRSVLMQSGHNDEVSNVWGVEQTRTSAAKVYALLGQPGRAPDLLRVPGFHGANDQERCLDWLDIQFGRSSRTWHNDVLFPWDFSDWQQRTGEALAADRYPERQLGERLAKLRAVADWEALAADIRSGLSWTLGDTPPRLPPAPPPTGRGGFTPRPAPGPTDVAKGAPGNPAQLGPDVPAWVISRGGQEFGWLEPEKDAVASRKLRFGPGLTGDLYFPTDTAEGVKLPTVVWLHGFSYPLGYMWVYRRDLHPILALVKAGYAVLAYDQSGFGSRMSESGPFYDRHPHWSVMGKLVEDARSALDALERDPLVDAQRLHLFGYTLGASVALHTAALDPRVKGVVSVAGFTPLRTDTADRGGSGLARYSHLRGLMPRLGLFIGNEARVPYDYDELLGLVAPRPVLVVQPQRDRDAHPADVRAAVEAARRVYSLHSDASKLGFDEPDDIARLTMATQNRIIEWMRAHF